MPFISHGSSLLKANVLIKQITVMARNWEEKTQLLHTRNLN